MIHHGDLFDVLPTLEADSIDACVTDPPYELGFMGKHWDGSGVTNRPETWAAVMRVLKPGAHLLAFGGTRTFHRMTCAIEDAGFEIRDCLSWLYGSGFPKSANVSIAIDKAAGVLGARGKAFRVAGAGDRDDLIGANGEPGYVTYEPITDAAKQWAGWGTALKPAWEPIILARKPTAGTVAANVAAHGTGALNIDACRLDYDPDLAKHWDREQSANQGIASQGLGVINLRGYAPSGRWPANVLLDEDAAAAVDLASGEVGGSGKASGPTLTGESQSFSRGRFAGVTETPFYGDTGGASRFFYVAKPSREERDYGCHGIKARTGGEATDRQDGTAGLNSPRAGAGRNGGSRNVHPTVKPIALMRYLVKLVTPPGGTVLDPFTGSGTTGMACRYEHREFIGIEREAEYVAIAEARIAAVAPLFAVSSS